ncbi:hypothetical protein BCR39DRAFT_522143 [Naematelia encephala]|uniref:GRF-type domain-containing protein n=1 Tax=Naematelia encephala TaxID=71784 RepID=A0A1Y2BDK5_9TREE|nr:hypothetical protein BCR39DRAFT_522143 [Naematelia encephala]
MSYTRSRPTATASTPQRIQIQPGAPEQDANVPKCTGHGRRALRLVAGANSKNPGRAFYTCPLNRDDPNKCKYFKWADEVDASPSKAGESSRAAQLTAATNARTLGQSPQAKFGRPVASAVNTTPTSLRATRAPLTPQTTVKEGSTDEIDWDQVDTDGLEAEAIASTPSSSQRTDGQSFNERLRSVGASTAKRRRSEEGEQTPRASAIDTESNPFLAAQSSPHAALSPTLSSLEQLSEHLHRQERLLRAGEAAKDGFRKKIRSLEERNAELEARVKELEKQLGGQTKM